MPCHHGTWYTSPHRIAFSVDCTLTNSKNNLIEGFSKNWNSSLSFRQAAHTFCSPMATSCLSWFGGLIHGGAYFQNFMVAFWNINHKWESQLPDSKPFDSVQSKSSPITQGSGFCYLQASEVFGGSKFTDWRTAVINPAHQASGNDLFV